jgi:hypothetical protein
MQMGRSRSFVGSGPGRSMRADVPERWRDHGRTHGACSVFVGVSSFAKGLRDGVMSPSAVGPVEDARRAFERELRAVSTVPATLDLLEATSERLRLRLVLVVGAGGYAPLLRRALHLVGKEHPPLSAPLVDAASSSPFVAVRARLARESLKTARSASVAIIATLLTLWAGFVGEELTRGIVREVWPPGAPAPARSRPKGRR